MTWDMLSTARRVTGSDSGHKKRSILPYARGEKEKKTYDTNSKLPLRVTQTDLERFAWDHKFWIFDVVIGHGP